MNNQFIMKPMTVLATAFAVSAGALTGGGLVQSNSRSAAMNVVNSPDSVSISDENVMQLLADNNINISLTQLQEYRKDFEALSENEKAQFLAQHHRDHDLPKYIYIGAGVALLGLFAFIVVRCMQNSGESIAPAQEDEIDIGAFLLALRNPPAGVTSWM